MILTAYKAACGALICKTISYTTHTLNTQRGRKQVANQLYLTSQGGATIKATAALMLR